MLKISDKVVIDKFPIATEEVLQFIKFLRAEGISVSKVVFWTHSMDNNQSFQVELELGDEDEFPEIPAGELQ